MYIHVVLDRSVLRLQQPKGFVIDCLKSIGGGGQIGQKMAMSKEHYQKNFQSQKYVHLSYILYLPINQTAISERLAS